MPNARSLQRGFGPRDAPFPCCYPRTLGNVTSGAECAPESAEALMKKSTAASPTAANSPNRLTVQNPRSASGPHLDGTRGFLPHQPTTPDTGEGGGRLKILVTDRDATSRFRTRELLEQEGYQVYEADDGETATELLSRVGGPRLVILDLTNPAVDAPALCRFVRSHYERPYVYIFLLASNETKHSLACGLQAGADDYLAKPFDWGELKARLSAGRRILALE